MSIKQRQISRKNRIVGSAVLGAAVAVFQPAVAKAEVLEFSSVDYGVAGDPFQGAPMPGESGTIYLTVKNPSTELLRDVVLETYPGDCVESIAGSYRFGDVAARQSMRSVNGLPIKIASACRRGSRAGFLALGTFLAVSGERRRVWSESAFVVAPVPIIEFLQENIGLALPDRQTTQFPFRISAASPIGDITIAISVTHRYPADLVVKIKHPSGRVVELGRLRDRSSVFGTGGTAVPALAQLSGLPSDGDWALVMTDDDVEESGTLNRVAVTIRSR